MNKREKILATALKLFVEFGFHNTPTSKIAQEAGIANGTLFYFFKTKDILVVALYLDLKAKMSDYIAVIIKDEITLKEIMKGYYTASLHWALQYKKEFRFIEQFMVSPYLNQIAAEEIEKHIKPVITMLKQGVKDKILKTIDVEIIFRLVSGHTFGINGYLAAKNLSMVEQDKIINETFEMLWKMIT